MLFAAAIHDLEHTGKIQNMSHSSTESSSGIISIHRKNRFSEKVNSSKYDRFTEKFDSSKDDRLVENF